MREYLGRSSMPSHRSGHTSHEAIFTAPINVFDWARSRKGKRKLRKLQYKRGRLKCFSDYLFGLKNQI
ncbi:hypothetical protein EUGRSUZ_K02260 [Eucalyptus grandis]|uniref:Uncharacterized protein n=2 Tax=Eucalyptus grandis TaxID=71139 RepID=A0ACC3IVT2_EUCGR|nr:hypothetical protein EUGRSUZ_K02260 [Eucalyptus grandis]